MTVRFTRLLDWVEGRLTETDAAEVERQVALDERARETVQWIREFHHVRGSGQLAEPPEELRSELRSMFARLNGTTGPARQGGVSFDSRSQRVVGMRGPASEALDLEHVVVGDGTVRIVLTLVEPGEGHVDVRGRVEVPEPEATPVKGEVVLVGPRLAPRAARVDLDGSFELERVSELVTELWFLGDTVQFRSALTLERT